MRVHVSDQEKLFRKYWLPIQQDLNASLTEFVRHYLMKEGKILKDADVYFELKDRLVNAKPAQSEAFLCDLHRHGQFYAKFIEPQRESDPEVAVCLDRLRRLKLTVAYPFLLRVFESAYSNTLTRDQLLQTLELLETFLIRRSVCNMPSNQLRRMLPPIFDAAGGAGAGFVDNLRIQLGGKRCPDDVVFVKALSTEILYSTAEKNARLRLILERIERSYNHKEPADLTGSQIEHVLPQSITPEWRIELGDCSEDTHEKLLHTLGNLTLTKYNADMSNKPYQEKRKAFANSHFVLNAYFGRVDKWSPEAIRERGQKLAQEAVSIWPDVGRENIAGNMTNKQTSIIISSVRFRTIVEPVVNWKDAFTRLLKYFEVNSPGLLLSIATEQTIGSVVSLNEQSYRRSKVKIGDVYVNTHASASQLQIWCRKIAKIGKFSEDEFEFITSEVHS